MMGLQLARKITVDPSMFHQEFEKLCAICGDKSTGNHFGSPGACEGCKGFFRRHVRTGKTFHCKWERNCEVTMSSRKRCKYCRFQKCLQVGMDPRAVQMCLGNVICKIDTHSKELFVPKTLDLTNLLQAEYMARGRGNEYLEAYAGLTWGKNRVLTALTDFKGGHLIINSDLIMMVEWVRNIPGFKFLPIEDQVLLFRAHASEYHVLSMAYRSMGQNDYVVFANGDLLPTPRQPPSSPTGKKPIRNRVLEDLSNPLGQINIDEIEFNCFKALVMLDPTVQGLSCRKKVAEMRKQAKTLLQQYLQSRQDHSWTSHFRMKNMLCLLSTLQDISSGWLESHRRMTNMGNAEMPRLMKDMFWVDPMKSGMDG